MMRFMKRLLRLGVTVLLLLSPHGSNRSWLPKRDRHGERDQHTGARRCTVGKDRLAAGSF